MYSNPDEVKLDLIVAARWDGAEGVVVLELDDPSGADLPEWAPGAHVDVELADGMTRQYSLCGIPSDRSSWRIAVLREPTGRGGSRHVHEALTEGVEVRLRGPRNHFPLVPSPRYVFIAGGIGITPIVPMLRAADAAGADWKLHYGGRSRESMAFLETLKDTSGHRLTPYPQDEVGLIDLHRILGTPQPDTLVYSCGPEPLLRAVEQHCADWPEGTLHLERFSSRDAGEPALTQTFEVELATTGVTLTVPPEKSVLEVVEEAGIPALASCREGICGTCETRVLGGEVDHRDSLMTPAEQATNDTMFICVSRAACPRLLLDL
ncbi:PDR/VanB family oxidoreductase [Streptomyces pseudovenezuelae]|uniref:PDR/VanB family oxidoreductase n=1 Tax=Streptomyces pseudovenezuelae TaxID=67350 RepID=UPI0036E87430